MKKITKRLLLVVWGLLLSYYSYADSYNTTYNLQLVDGVAYLFNGGEATVTYQQAIWRTYQEERGDDEDTWYEDVTVLDHAYSDYSGDFVIPASVTYKGTTYEVTGISERAFQGCSGITSISIPDNVTSIGSYAFSGCSGITSISIPDNVTSIGSYAFSGCSGIISLSIPNNVTYIGSYTFQNCSNLFSVTIPNSVTSIYDYAFSGCSSLTSITIPNSVGHISDGVFDDCRALKTLIIEDGSTSLNLSYNKASWEQVYSWYDGEGLFHDCPLEYLYIGRNISAYQAGNSSYGYSPFYLKTKLKEVIIGTQVTNIQEFTCYFSNSSNHSSPRVFCYAITPPSLGSNNTFGNDKKIYVPYSSVMKYRKAWGTDYLILPLLDVMFFEDQTAESYAAELNGKNKSEITSVAFYDGELDATLTESVMKNGMNPNCLYYVPASAGLSGENIISLDNFEAESITLTDNYSYYCPIPFHAETIKYVHNPSVWANGSAGWETICLPFAPTTFEASERGYISPIMLGSTGNFWLRKFVGASSDAVYFTSTIDGQMEANTPYLIAFPGSSMGNGHLEGQTITFKGYDADIQVTEQPEVKNNNFIFVGNYDTAADGIEGYALNAAGSMFTRSTNVGNQPFRAYFRNEAGQASNVKLFIDPDNPTDIRSLAAPSDMNISSLGHGGLMIQSNSDREIRVYSIDGRLERTLQLTAGENRIDGLHKGLYIIDNKKIMIR